MICNLISVSLKDLLYDAHFLCIVLLLLMQSGDIEPNPGPATSYNGSITILHSNIRSLRNKLNFIKETFLDFNILAFTESHLDASVTTENILLEQFDTPYRKDRTNHGGGVIIYVSNDLLHTRKPELEIYCDESIWIEIKMRNETFLLGTFYSPRTSDATFFEGFNRNIEKAMDLCRNIVILGDLNEDLLNPNFNNLEDILMLNSLKNVISEPTRLNALLDPIITNEDLYYSDAGIIPVPDHISDHSATFITLPFQYEPQSPFKRTVWMYKQADFNALNMKIRNFDWSCLSEGSVHEATYLFNNIFMEMIKSCIPSKAVTVRPDDKPWYNSEIRTTSRKRDRMKHKALRSGKTSDWKNYKKLRNKVNNQKKYAKETFFNNLELSILDFHTNDKRKFWKVIRHFVKNSDASSTIPPLSLTLPSGETKIHFTDEEKADCLNEYFASISTVDDQHAQLPPFYAKTPNTMSNVNCTQEEIELLIETLNPNKANGLDGISNRMLKAVCKTISRPLAIIINRSFSEGEFPEPWKSSGLIPVPKKGEKTSPSNYRPIALLSNISKIQERIAFKNLFNYLHENDLLYKYQSGFLPQHSTVFQLVDIYHNICQCFDNHQFSCMVFCDISKAFDRVWHKGLIFKLRQYGIRGDFLNWLTDYLEGRQQKVIIKGCTSDFKSVTAGVPQGSVLGPLLFLVYVNDIADSLLSLTRLFADDSSLFYSATSLDDIQGIINHDLRVLSEWAKQWLVTFNPKKTEAILFTLRNPDFMPLLIFDGTNIKFVENHKHLGLTFSHNGQWTEHIRNIKVSAAKLLGIMRKLKFSFSRSALNQIYMSYLLPILEYGSVVWDGCTLQNTDILDKIQNEAARIVTGLTRSVSLDRLYRECGWLRLSARRQQQKLLFMFKVNQNLVPTYIDDLIPPLVRDVSNYPLRNMADYTVPFARTEIFKKSCIPSSLSLWNAADNDLKTLNTLSAFRYHLKRSNENFHGIPKHYLSGERRLAVLHARIRNHCSNLNADLYSNFLCPDPICSCLVENETAEHYFLRCNKYDNQRLALLNSLQTLRPISVELLLFGNPNAITEENNLIFASVQRFIKASDRFA